MKTRKYKERARRRAGFFYGFSPFTIAANSTLLQFQELNVQNNRPEIDLAIPQIRPECEPVHQRKLFNFLLS
jgi:hypothetical protein